MPDYWVSDGSDPLNRDISLDSGMSRERAEKFWNSLKDYYPSQEYTFGQIFGWYANMAEENNDFQMDEDYEISRMASLASGDPDLKNSYIPESNTDLLDEEFLRDSLDFIDTEWFQKLAIPYGRSVSNNGEVFGAILLKANSIGEETEVLGENLLSIPEESIPRNYKHKAMPLRTFRRLGAVGKSDSGELYIHRDSLSGGSHPYAPQPVEEWKEHFRDGETLFDPDALELI